MPSRPLREEVAEAIRQAGVGSNMEARAACAVIARRLREATGPMVGLTHYELFQLLPGRLRDLLDELEAP
jgi:hypothetical protein